VGNQEETCFGCVWTPWKNQDAPETDDFGKVDAQSTSSRKNKTQNKNQVFLVKLQTKRCNYKIHAKIDAIANTKMSSRRRAETARVLAQALGGILFLAFAAGIITIGVLLGQVRSSQVTFDPADPVFHGTNTSNTVLGTTTIGPRFGRTDGVVPVKRAQINIGAYDSTPGLDAQMGSPPGNFAYRAIHIGMASLTNSSAEGSVAIGNQFACGSGVGTSGAESVCIGTNGVNYGQQNVWIGSNNGCAWNLNSHIIGFQNHIYDITSNQDAIFGSRNNIVTSSNANIVGVDVTITSSDNSHAFGSGISISNSATSVLIGSSSSITNAPNSVVIGNAASSTIENGVAIGNSAMASAQNVENSAVLSINVGHPTPENPNSPIQSGAAGEATQHLLIRINGIRYKISVVQDVQLQK
jgi:hypothetical protein